MNAIMLGMQEGNCGTTEDLYDCWAQWVLHRRHGDDKAALERLLPVLRSQRDAILDGAELCPSDAVLDVGCGDGLLGFGALERLNTMGRVTFSDTSQALVQHCREVAAESDSLSQCAFIVTGLPSLSAIPDGSHDAAVLRSVLIYVEDKRRSFENLQRILRSGGRISLFEPINRFVLPRSIPHLWGFSVAGLEDIAAKVTQAYESCQPLDGPMLNFDERDLLRYAVDSGFMDVRLRYTVDIVRRDDPVSWTALLKFSPNPLSPILDEVLDSVLTRREREKLTECLQAQLKRPRTTATAVAYLSARTF